MAGEGKVTGETLDRARAYTAAVPGAISGSRGHDQTFALANALTWGFALNEPAALVLMLEWNAGCQPPWRERDLLHKIHQSQKASHQKPFGYLLTAGERPQKSVVLPLAPPAEKAVWKIKHRPPPSLATVSTIVDVPSTPPATDWTALDAEFPPDDEEKNWQAVIDAGFGEEPLILAAFTIFGPDCTVVETGRADA